MIKKSSNTLKNINFKVDELLWKKLKQLATEQRRSMNQALVVILEEHSELVNLQLSKNN